MGLFVMHIIEIVDYQIVLTEEAMMMRPIRELWNADRSKNKEKFMQQASVIYNMADPRATYNFIIDEKDRLNEIIAQEGLPKDFKIDDKVAEAIEWYKKHTLTTSTLLLEDARAAVDKVRTFLREVDLNKEDDKGKPVYTVNSITTALKQIPQLALDLKNTEKIVNLEIEEAGRARGGNESKSLMDDGVLL